MRAGSLRPGVARVLVVALSVVAIAAGCGGGAPTPTATPVKTPKPPATKVATPSLGPSGSAASASPSASATIDSSAGAHADPALEKLLPVQVGAYELYKQSFPLSMYLNSSKANDKPLYQDWLGRLGVKPEETSLALGMDVTDKQVITVLALKPNTADPARLLPAFREALDAQKWPNRTILLAQKNVVQATDVGGAADGTDAMGYAYAKDGVLFLVITQDPALALQAFIAMP